MAHAQADAEVGVGAVNRIETTNVKRVKAHWVIRACREHRWQRFAASRVVRMHTFGWRPGRAIFLTFYRGSPADRRIFTQFTDTNWQNHDGFAALRVVVKTHLRAVNHNAFTRCVRQDQLLWDDHFAASLWQINVNARIGFQHIAEAHLVLCRKSFQRQFAVFRNSNFDIFPDQTAVGRRQRVNHSKG